MRAVLFALLLAAAFPVAADVYRCTDGAGKVTYADQPCGADARKLEIVPPPDEFANIRVKSRLGPPGTKLDIPSSLVTECFDMYRAYARDPTTAKLISYVAMVAQSGAPFVRVDSVFTNKNGGPDRYEAWCGLTDSLAINRPASERSVNLFRESQDEFYAKMQAIKRQLK